MIEWQPFLDFLREVILGAYMICTMIGMLALAFLYVTAGAGFSAFKKPEEDIRTRMAMSEEKSDEA